MKFGSVRVGEAHGSILAHALRLPDGRRLAKGSLLEAAEIAAIEAAGIKEIVVARIGPDDVGEDEAALRIARRLVGPHVRMAAAATGRVNLHATANGLFMADRALVDRLNAIDPGITLATLNSPLDVGNGRMVATVKIIPYAVSTLAVAEAEAQAGGAIQVMPYRAMRVGVVSTTLASLKGSVMDKTMRVLAARLQPSGSSIIGEKRVGHTQAEVAGGLTALMSDSDLIIVFGASAISDIDDIIPAAIRQVGGRIERFGMPVDPGNLLLIGQIGSVPVIGAPGCARSPAENGFDWVLQRLLAGRPVKGSEIAGMGVGGLLMEIGTRPQPRDPVPHEPLKVAAVILAAGQGTRMGGLNKMTFPVEGRPMVGHAIDAATQSRAVETLVVTGHQREAVEAVAAGAPVSLIHNPDYRDGLSTSLAAGIAALGEEIDAVIVLLGDMPRIGPEMINRMIECADRSPQGTIVMASHEGRRGNPVLWPRRHFAELMRITGDVGARGLIAEHAATVVAVEIGPAASFDVDTPQSLSDEGSREPA